jgi:putative ABC transport system ATP-binding protein
MITFSHIEKTYANGHHAITALARTDLCVKAGEFIVIVGRSGAGKSTLLGIAGGLLRPSTGRVDLNGHCLWTGDEKSRALIRAQDIGFIFQNASVISSLTLLENVLLASAFTAGPLTEAQQRARLLLNDVGLGDRLHAFPDQISGGEKRRVAVASALMNSPSLLLADEPTGELDPETESQILALIQQANEQGSTVLLVTHNHDLKQYGDRVFTMDQGQLTEEGTGS